MILVQRPLKIGMNSDVCDAYVVPDSYKTLAAYSWLSLVKRKYRNTTDATSGGGTSYISLTHELTPGF